MKDAAMEDAYRKYDIDPNFLPDSVKFQINRLIGDVVSLTARVEMFSQPLPRLGEKDLVVGHVYEGSSGGDRFLAGMGGDEIFYRFCWMDVADYTYSKVFCCKRATFKKWGSKDVTSKAVEGACQAAFVAVWDESKGKW